MEEIEDGSPQKSIKRRRVGQQARIDTSGDRHIDTYYLDKIHRANYKPTILAYMMDPCTL